VIEFDKYKIEKIRKQDAKELNQLMVLNKERFKTYFPKTLYQNLTLEASIKFTQEKTIQFATKEEFLFTVKELTYKQLIGLVFIKELDWTKGQGEFAYCIDADFQRKGIISSVIDKLVAYAFDNLGLKTLQIIVNKDNFGSVKVAEKCNFIWQKTLLKEFTPPNASPLDMELYELYN